MKYTKDDVKRLTNYLKQEQKEGYSVPQLRNYLISKGYGKEVVDEAIDNLYSRRFNFSDGEKKILFFVVIIIAFIGVTSLGYFLIFGDSTPQTILDNDKQNKDIGEEIDFTKPQQGPHSVDEEGVIEDKNAPSTKVSDSQEDEVTPSSTSGKENSAKSCPEIEDTSRRDQCYLSEAYSENNFELCGRIINTGKQNLCRSMGRTQDKLNSDRLAFEFSSGEIKPLDQTDGDALLLKDYLNLEAEEVIEESKI